MNHHLKQNGRVLTIIFVCLVLSVITVPVFAAIPVKSATASVLASAAPIKVSGLVVDENGEPLPGVSIVIQERQGVLQLTWMDLSPSMWRLDANWKYPLSEWKRKWSPFRIASRWKSR